MCAKTFVYRGPIRALLEFGDSEKRTEVEIDNLLASLDSKSHLVYIQPNCSKFLIRPSPSIAKKYLLNDLIDRVRYNFENKNSC